MKIRKSTLLRTIIFILIIFLIILTGYLAIVDSKGSTVCLIGEHASCSIVQNSQYGKILGVKVIWLGFFAFIILLLTYYQTFSKKHYDKSTHRIYIILASFGAIFAIYFIYIQHLILKEYCSSCLVIDTSMLLIFVLSVIEFFKTKRRWSIG